MRLASRFRATALFATIALCACVTLPAVARAASALPETPGPAQLIQPADLARAMADSTGHRPTVLHVGFKGMYQTGHIAGTAYFGPASKPAGLAALQAALKPLPRTGPLVLYCGCCPWKDCPNVQPAYRLARKMGFKDVRLLYVAKNLGQDWIDHGFPTTRQ